MKSVHDQVYWRNAFLGIPALAMGKEVPQEQRAARILQLKPNQIIRAVKECSTSIYRHANQLIQGDRRHSVSRVDNTALQVTVLCGDTRIRRMLMLEHAKAAFSKSGKPERIPVLEYALLEAWAPDIGDLQNGTFAPDRMDKRTKNTQADTPLRPNKEIQSPFLSTIHTLYFQPIDSDQPWMCSAEINPYWLLPFADRLLIDLSHWNDHDHEKRSLVAGADRKSVV